MDRSYDWLTEAARQGIISDAQAQELQAFAEKNGPVSSSADAGTAQFEGAHLLYYMGGLIAIGAMTVFMTLGWEQFGGWAVFGIAVLYAAGGMAITERLYQNALRIPAGLTAAFVVVLAPMAVYGIQLELGLWPDDETYRAWLTGFDGRGLVLQVVTLLLGSTLLVRYRLPFLLMPLVVVAWYMMMNTTPYLTTTEPPPDVLYRTVALGAGAILIGGAIWIDRQRYTHDFAFWPYTLGTLSVWGSLTTTAIVSTWPSIWYAGICVVLMGIGVMVRRRIFTIVGALGLAGYLFYLARDIFRDSIWFPFVLTFIGLGIIALGVWWQRNEKTIHQRMQDTLPF